MSPLQESYFVLTFSVDLRLFPNCRLSLWATLTTLELHRCISAAALFLRSRSPLFAWNILNNRQIMISSCAHLSYPLGVLLPYLFYKAFILCAQFHEHLCLCLQENSWFCCWQCKLAEESDKRVEEELSLEIQLGVCRRTKRTASARAHSYALNSHTVARSGGRIGAVGLETVLSVSHINCSRHFLQSHQLEIYL